MKNKTITPSSQFPDTNNIGKIIEIADGKDELRYAIVRRQQSSTELEVFYLSQWMIPRLCQRIYFWVIKRLGRL